MKPNPAHSHYLQDLGHLLLTEAKHAVMLARANPGDLFAAGRASAYHHIVDLMVRQAGAFQISLDDLALLGVDVDKDLVA